MKNSVNILGTEYSIAVKKYDEHEAFKRRNCDGFCSEGTHEIILCDMRTWPDMDHETDALIEAQMKHTLRHEIVHAFFNESGLSNSSFKYDGGWATAEEMVDWIALQGPKIYAAWQAAGAL